MIESLAELLATCVNLHVTLLPTGDGQLAVDAPKVVATPEFLNRIKAHKAGLLATLQSTSDPFADWRVRVDPAMGRVVLYDPARHDGRPIWVDGPGESLESRHAGYAAAVGPDDPAWPGWLADFVLLLAPDDLPEGLRLDAATVVVDRAKYLAALRAAIRRGARGPRAAVLEEELERLRGVLEEVRQDVRQQEEGADRRGREDDRKLGPRCRSSQQSPEPCTQKCYSPDETEESKGDGRAADWFIG